MMKLPSLKKRHPIVYISLAMYLLASLFIIVESFLPSGISGLQSMLFADLSAIFVNEITGPQIPKEILPLEVESVFDSSYLGKNKQDESLIALGTTTLLSIKVKYPKKDNSYDVYKQTYTVENALGNKDDYNVVLSSGASKEYFTINLRVVAINNSSDLYQVNVNIAETLTYNYKFHIVELATPTNYESKISKTTLKIGESASITTKLLDEKQGDTYLRRYLDESKISRSSSNMEVATIDEFGVVHALKEGNAKITFGKYDFNINVTNESIVKPVGNGLDLKISEKSKHALSLRDYDYIFEENYDANAYSVLVYPEFIDDALEDKSVSWEVSDYLMGMIAPYKYDEEGYPIYKDELDRYCVRVCGYRRQGTVTLTCYSNADKTISKSIDIDVVEAKATSMTLSVKGNPSIYVNAQLVISASFEPGNVNNTNLYVEASNDVVSIVGNNTSSVILKGDKVGTSHIKVKSLNNEELVQEFDINVEAKQAINPENYTDFHQAIRKFLGHFLLFLATAIFGAIFFYTYFNDKKKWWIVLLITLVLGFALAGLSELIQLLIATRSGLWTDVIIDFMGYFFGSIFTIGAILLIELIKKKKLEKNIS